MRRASRHDRARGRRGLTLLELLVALGIGVLLLSVAAGIIGRTARAREALATRSRAVAAARGALWLLRDDLAAQRPGTLRIERVAPGAAPTVSLEQDLPEPRELVYRLEHGRLVRLVRDRLRTPERWRRSVVVTGVRRLDVVALGNEGWRDAWTAPRPPRVLTITLACAGAPDFTVAVAPLVGGAA